MNASRQQQSEASIESCDASGDDDDDSENDESNLNPCDEDNDVSLSQLGILPDAS